MCILQHYVVDGKLGSALPVVIFGASALVAGILATFLPETKGKVLPETVEDAKNLKK